MTTNAGLGWGSEFHLDDAAGTETELVEVISLKPPMKSSDIVEATHMKSAGKLREYIAGLIDGGEADVTMNLVPGSATDLLCNAAVGARRDYKIVIPTPTGTWEATGQVIVQTYDRETPIDDRMTATMSVKFTSEATEAAGA